MSDLIERDKVAELFKELFEQGALTLIGNDYLQRKLEAIPSARPKGEWIDMGDFEQCSVCKGTRLKEFQTYYGKATWVKTDFCPSCGADMRGERADEHGQNKSADKQ